MYHNNVNCYSWLAGAVLWHFEWQHLVQHVAIQQLRWHWAVDHQHDVNLHPHVVVMLVWLLEQQYCVHLLAFQKPVLPVLWLTISVSHQCNLHLAQELNMLKNAAPTLKYLSISTFLLTPTASET